MTELLMIRPDMDNNLFAPSLAHLADAMNAARQTYYGPDTIYQRGHLSRFCTVPVGVLTEGRFQPRKRMDEDGLRDLAEDIKAHGIVNPLKCFVNERQKLELLAGHRRLAAAKLADLQMVPVDVMEGTLEFMREVTIIDNLQREDLSPLEEAEAFKRMAEELGISDSEIARRVGKSRGFVQQRLAIARSDDKIRDAIADNTISLTTGRTIAQSTDDKKVQKKALAHILKRQKTGARTDEADVRRLVADTVQQVAQDTLKKLGWTVSDRYIWGGCHRPRHWSAEEMTQAVQDQRTPDGEPPTPGEITADQWSLLSFRYMEYWHAERYAPWLALSNRETYAAEFYSASEIPDLVLRIGREFYALRQGFADQGWEYTIADTGGHRISHVMGRDIRVLNERDARQVLERIKAGEEYKTAQAEREYKWQCGHCKHYHEHPAVKGVWFNHQQVCPDCYAVAQQGYAEHRERIKEDFGMVLVRMPTELMRLLLGRFHRGGSMNGMDTILGNGYLNDTERWARLSQADEDTLRTVLLDCLAEDSYERERNAA